jgi:hypothetical protein
MQSGLVGGEGLSITFKLGLKRSIQHIRLSRTTVISTPKRARSNLKLHHSWRCRKGPTIGLLRDAVEVTTNTNLKVRYESYEEVRAALLEEGVNVDRLPLLTDMRPPEGQERN